VSTAGAQILFLFPRPSAPTVLRRTSHKATLDGAYRPVEDALWKLACDLNLPQSFRFTFDSLFDALLFDVSGPVEVVWKNSELARAEMGPDFGRVVDTLNAISEKRANFSLRLA
jgi:ribonuclease inhibitor